MPATELAIRNGHVATVATEDPNQESNEQLGRRILKGLPASARRYIIGMGADIGEMAALENRLAKKEQDLKRKLARSAEAQQLKEVKAKRKELRQKMQTSVQRIDGVIEAHLDEVMPGSTTEEKINALMASANTKQLEGKR